MKVRQGLWSGTIGFDDEHGPSMNVPQPDYKQIDEIASHEACLERVITTNVIARK